MNQGSDVVAATVTRFYLSTNSQLNVLVKADADGSVSESAETNNAAPRGI